MTGKLERLVSAGIQLLPALEITTHFVFERDGFVALVERRDDDFGAVGTAGLLTDRGVAPLMIRNGHAVFVTKGHEIPAEPAQIESLRSFQKDLLDALQSAP